MKAYLGPLGSMVALPYVSSLATTATRSATERVTLGGKLRMQTSRVERRTWSFSMGALRPNELGELAELLSIGRPPWAWIDPWAQTTNLLTPEQSVFAPGTFSGAGELGGRLDLGADGFARWSFLPSGWVDIGQRTPVEAGQAVSASAWVTGEKVLASLVWQHADGRYEETRYTQSTSKDRPRRLAVSGRPKASVRSVALRIKGASAIARPAITWTPTPVQWHTGQGCSSAVVLEMPQEIVSAYRTSRGLRSANTSITVQEVG